MDGTTRAPECDDVQQLDWSQHAADPRRECFVAGVGVLLRKWIAVSKRFAGGSASRRTTIRRAATQRRKPHINCTRQSAAVVATEEPGPPDLCATCIALLHSTVPSVSADLCDQIGRAHV